MAEADARAKDAWQSELERAEQETVAEWQAKLLEMQRANDEHATEQVRRGGGRGVGAKRGAGVLDGCALQPNCTRNGHRTRYLQTHILPSEHTLFLTSTLQSVEQGSDYLPMYAGFEPRFRTLWPWSRYCLWSPWLVD